MFSLDDLLTGAPTVGDAAGAAVAGAGVGAVAGTTLALTRSELHNAVRSHATLFDTISTDLSGSDEVGTGGGTDALVSAMGKLATHCGSLSDMYTNLANTLNSPVTPALLADAAATAGLQTVVDLCTSLEGETGNADLGTGGVGDIEDGEEDEDGKANGEDKSNDDKSTSKSNDTGGPSGTSPSTVKASNVGTTTTSATPMAATSVPNLGALTGLTQMANPSSLLTAFNPMSGVFGGTGTPGVPITGGGTGVTADEVRQMVADAKNRVGTASASTPTGERTSSSPTPRDPSMKATREGTRPLRVTTPDVTAAPVPLVQGQTVQGGVVDPAQTAGRPAQTATTLSAASPNSGTGNAAGARPAMGGMMSPMGGMMGGAGASKSSASTDKGSELLSDDPLLTGRAMDGVAVKGGVLGKTAVPDSEASTEKRKDDYLW